MRKLTKETLKQFIEDEAKIIYPETCRPEDMPVGKRGKAFMEECFQLGKKNLLPNLDVDDSYDWQGQLVMNDKDAREFALGVSYTMPLIITDKDSETGENRNLKNLTPETLEVLDKTAEKYGYYLIDRLDWENMISELGYDLKKTITATGLYS